MMTNKMYTVRQAAIVANVDEATIRLAIRQEEIHSYSSHLGLLIRQNDLATWVGMRTGSKIENEMPDMYVIVGRLLGQNHLSYRLWSNDILPDLETALKEMDKFLLVFPGEEYKILKLVDFDAEEQTDENSP